MHTVRLAVPQVPSAPEHYSSVDDEEEEEDANERADEEADEEEEDQNGVCDVLFHYCLVFFPHSVRVFLLFFGSLVVPHSPSSKCLPAGLLHACFKHLPRPLFSRRVVLPSFFF